MYIIDDKHIMIHDLLNDLSVQDGNWARDFELSPNDRYIRIKSTTGMISGDWVHYETHRSREPTEPS